MTYDDWKATDTTPEPEREGWCGKCEHYECDCPCCNEPSSEELKDLATRVNGAPPLECPVNERGRPPKEKS